MNISLNPNPNKRKETLHTAQVSSVEELGNALPDIRNNGALTHFVSLAVNTSEAGEIPKACVVVREEIDAQTLQDFIAERVAPHKKIREVEFVDQIPKSPSGKILRRMLVERERLKAAP